MTVTDPNAGATQATLRASNVQVAGRSELYIGDRDGSNLRFFGIQMDDTPISWREFYNDVPADSHGGPQGPPIERQVLGRIATINFTLSVWTQDIRYTLEEHGGAYQYVGGIQNEEIGRLLFTNHAHRLLIVPALDTPISGTITNKSNDYFTYNFPTALLSSPIEAGQGTKFSALRFSMEGHRTPPSLTKAGQIWDRDITGYVAAAEARDQAYRQIAERVRRGGPAAGPVQVDQ